MTKEVCIENFQPIETIRYWISVYSNPESEEHFLGHGKLVEMLQEYLALRESILNKDNSSVQKNEDFYIIDRFLRNNLDDTDYEEYSTSLERLYNSAY